MASLYDLLGGAQSETLPAYDEQPAPILAQPEPAGPAPAKAPATSGWTRLLKSLTQNQGQGTSAPGMQPPTRAAQGTQAPLQSSALSSQGFISGSRGGFSLGDLMKVAAIVASFGAATPAVAGAAGAGGAMGGGLPMGGGGGASGGGGAMGGGGLMGMLGGMGGGGSGGGGSEAGPAMTYAPLPPQTGPLVPQSAAQWQLPTYQTLYG